MSKLIFYITLLKVGLDKIDQLDLFYQTVTTFNNT